MPQNMVLDQGLQLATRPAILDTTDSKMDLCQYKYMYGKELTLVLLDKLRCHTHF